MNCSYIVVASPVEQLQVKAAQGTCIKMGVMVVESCTEPSTYATHSLVFEVLLLQFLHHASSSQLQGRYEPHCAPQGQLQKACRWLGSTCFKFCSRGPACC